jgi:hypothetical protein
MKHTRCGQVLIILLFIIVSIGFCLAEVEIRVWNEKTKKFETLEMTPELRGKMERQEAIRRSEKKSSEQTVSPPAVRRSPS